MDKIRKYVSIVSFLTLTTNDTPCSFGITTIVLKYLNCYSFIKISVDGGSYPLTLITLCK